MKNNREEVVYCGQLTVGMEVGALLLVLLLVFLGENLPSLCMILITIWVSSLLGGLVFLTLRALLVRFLDVGGVFPLSVRRLPDSFCRL